MRARGVCELSTLLAACSGLLSFASARRGQRHQSSSGLRYTRRARPLYGLEIGDRDPALVEFELATFAERRVIGAPAPRRTEALAVSADRPGFEGRTAPGAWHRPGPGHEPPPKSS